MKTNQVQEFIDEFGEDAFEELYEACRERKGTERVAILESIMHDAVNWTHHGTFTTDEADVVFELHDGNWNGTELFYGEDYEFKRPVEYRFVLKPVKELNPAMQSVYDLWKKQAWFTELEGKANYDLKFSPTTAIRQHYDGLAEKRGLRFVAEPVP